MSRPDATPAERGRLRLSRCVVDDGWPLRRAAKRVEVSVNAAPPHDNPNTVRRS